MSAMWEGKEDSEVYLMQLNFMCHCRSLGMVLIGCIHQKVEPLLMLERQLNTLRDTAPREGANKSLV